MGVKVVALGLRHPQAWKRSHLVMKTSLRPPIVNSDDDFLHFRQFTSHYEVDL